MPATLPVHDRIDRLDQSLVVEAPGIAVTVDHYGYKLRVTTLTNREAPREQLHLMQMVREVLTQYGHGLREEFDFTGQDLEPIEESGCRLALDGYE